MITHYVTVTFTVEADSKDDADRIVCAALEAGIGDVGEITAADVEKIETDEDFEPDTSTN